MKIKILKNSSDQSETRYIFYIVSYSNNNNEAFIYDLETSKVAQQFISSNYRMYDPIEIFPISLNEVICS